MSQNNIIRKKLIASIWRVYLIYTLLATLIVLGLISLIMYPIPAFPR